jgi:cupin 2 domain-containing protein
VRIRPVERLLVLLRSLPGAPFGRGAPARPVRGNLAAGIPRDLPEEHLTTLARARGLRVERIVSRGHVSPPGFWYEQDEDELVVLIAGAARLAIEGEGEAELTAGDWIDLPRRVRHRVTWTDPDRDTIWLAVYRRR